MSGVYSFVEGAGDLATWIGSLGTIGAFIVAFWQIRRERVERHRRDRRERWERLREHADHVTAWVADGHVTIANSSRHPVFDVCIRWHDGQQRVFDFVAPGTTHDRVDAAVASGAVPYLDFTDPRGHRWQRELGKTPRMVYDAAGPAERPDAAGTGVR